MNSQDKEASNQEVTSSKFYLVVNATLNTDNPEDIKAYTGNVVPLLMAAGGRNLRRAKLSSVIKGQSRYPLMLFMEFDSENAIKEAFETEEYKRLIPHRDKAFSELDILIFTDM